MIAASVVLLGFAYFAYQISNQRDKMAIENFIKQSINDPDSAIFKDFAISPKKTRACIVWNSKNRMGGYGEWRLTELKKVKSEWSVAEWSGNPEACTQVSFETREALFPAN